MSTLIVGLVAGAVFAAQPALPCAIPGPPSPRVDVQIEQPVRARDLTLVQIAALHALLGDTSHRPLGFYASRFALVVQIEPDDAVTTCSAVRVRLTLSSRRIEIAHEIADRPCLSAAAVTHYEGHAEAEAAAVGQLAERVRHRLMTPEVAGILEASAPAQEKRSAVTRLAIEPELAAYRDSLAATYAALDDEMKVGNIDQTCSGQQ
ncbi:MAG: hypothetical protein WDN25_14450 [Acetobacteraceae bacterium]